MTMQPTSLAAYDDLRATLSVRHTRVLTALERWYADRHYWPTAYELYDAMQREGLAHDLNDVRPRLTELRERLKLVENPDKRPCNITHKRALVWRHTRPGRLF